MRRRDTVPLFQHCEGGGENGLLCETDGRFRTIAGQFFCDRCYREWLDTPGAHPVIVGARLETPAAPVVRTKTTVPDDFF